MGKSRNLASTAGATDAETRDNLGLGDVATQEASNVTITGGSVTGVDLTSSNATITGGEIFGAALGVEAAVATSNVLTLDYGNASVFTHTASTTLAITPTNFPAEEGIVLLKLTNGGSQTISFTGNAAFVANTAPTLTAAGTDFLFIQGNTTHYSVFTQLDVF